MSKSLTFARSILHSLLSLQLALLPLATHASQPDPLPETGGVEAQVYRAALARADEMTAAGWTIEQPHVVDGKIQSKFTVPGLSHEGLVDVVSEITPLENGSSEIRLVAALPGPSGTVLTESKLIVSASDLQAGDAERLFRQFESDFAHQLHASIRGTLASTSETSGKLQVGLATLEALGGAAMLGLAPSVIFIPHMDILPSLAAGIMVVTGGIMAKTGAVKFFNRARESLRARPLKKVQPRETRAAAKI